jgi:glycosyltransferase involved in cell wall biosynthesis
MIRPKRHALVISTHSWSAYKFGLPVAKLLKADGYEVTVVCSNEAFADAPSYIGQIAAGGWRVETVPMCRTLAPMRDIKALWALFLLIRKYRISAVYSQNSKAGVLCRFAARMARVPIIVHMVHDFAFRSGSSNPRDLLYLVIEWLASKCADMHLFESEAERDKALRHHIVSEPKLRLVGQGVDSAEYSSDAVSGVQRRELIERYGLDSDRIIIGAVARLVPHKGLDCFLRAAQIVLAVESDVQFVIVGGGDLRGELEGLARELHVYEKVTFTGFLAGQPGMPTVFSMMDIFCLPTRKEGFGVVFAEAMAMSKPVVASDIAPVNTIIEHEVTGFLVPPDKPERFADALLALVRSAELRVRMGSAGRKRVERLFSEKGMLDLIGSALQEVERVKCGVIGTSRVSPSCATPGKIENEL